MDTDFIQLNHGSYGTYPKSVSKALISYQLRAERNPDLWLRREVKTELAHVRQLLSQLIGAESDDIVMVPNVTSGINAILRSLVFSFGQRILHLSTAYASMASLIDYLVDFSQVPISKLVLNVTYPMTNSQFLKILTTFLDQNQDPERPIRVAIIDHITSVPAVVIPIDKVIPLLKQRNISVIVDGAHAIGQVPINITALDPDYYVTDCHKWLFAARGCALLYVKKSLQGDIHPAPINAAYKRPSGFQTEFFWTGTMDYSPYMTVPAALEFRQGLGGENEIMEYNKELAWIGGHLMADRLQTRVLQNWNQMGSMVDVQLPVKNVNNSLLESGDWWVDKQLYKYTSTFSPVYKHNNLWWVRVSAQIYNDLSDFEVSAQHFKDICRELNEMSNNLTVLEQ